MSQRTDTIAQALGEFVQLNGQVAANVLLVRDPAWTINMALALSMIEFAATELRDHAEVPAEARELHGTLLSVSIDLIVMLHEYMKGVDTLNAANINNAKRRLDAVSRKTAIANQQLLALRATQGR